MSSWRRELRQTARLAAPIVAVQLGQMSLGLVDVLMVGRWSDEALAGIALGHMFVWALLIFGLGMLAALDPVIAQAVGAGDPQRIRQGTQRGVVLAILISIPLTLGGTLVGPILEALQQPVEVRPLAVAYVWWTLPSILPFLLFVAFRQSLQALSRVRPVLLVTIAANLLNALLNWLLIFGHLGLPAMGLRGSALASDISRLWLALGLLWAGWPVLGPYLRHFDLRAFRPSSWLPLFRLGLPIGLQFLLEMGAFSATAIFVGWFGTIPVGGHKVALMLASFTFMVPVGISAAVAVRVGYAVGRKDLAGARRAATVSMLLGVGAMTVSAAAFLLAPGALAHLFTDSPAVLPIAIALIPIAGVFQIFDGIQVVSIGILRGFAETRTPLILNVVGFWMLGIPVGLYLAFERDLGPQGLWWGLVTGLGIVAIVLSLRIHHRLRR